MHRDVRWVRLKTVQDKLCLIRRPRVKESLGKHNPVLTKPQDVVLFGFGRIGRLITRLILEDSGAGETVILKAIVVRKSKNEDIFKSRCAYAIERYTGVVYEHLDL